MAQEKNWLLQINPDLTYIKSPEFANVIEEFKKRGHQRIFIEVESSSQKHRSALFDACQQIADLLMKYEVALFDPIVVSVNKLPDGEQREALEWFANRGITATLSNFEDYKQYHKA